jgi:hypothetical protein
MVVIMVVFDLCLLAQKLQPTVNTEEGRQTAIGTSFFSS